MALNQEASEGIRPHIGGSSGCHPRVHGEHACARAGVGPGHEATTPPQLAVRRPVTRDAGTH